VSCHQPEKKASQLFAFSDVMLFWEVENVILLQQSIELVST